MMHRLSLILLVSAAQISILTTVLIGAMLLISVDGSAQIFERVTVGSPVLENTADARAGGLGGAVVSVHTAWRGDSAPDGSERTGRDRR